MGEWKHRLTNKDLITRTAHCALCGNVSLNKSSAKGRCNNAVKEYKRLQSTSKLKRHSYIGSGSNRKYVRYPEGVIRPDQCDICGGGTRIAYDHDHKTDKFRGWLCMKCNTALGLANDDIGRLNQLIDYLKKHETIQE